MAEIPQKITVKSAKEILSQPQLLFILKKTALSKVEAIETWMLYKLGILGDDVCYGYIGNVGIKTFILPKLKLYIDTSYDIDVAVPSVSYFKNLEIKKERLIDEIIHKQYGFSYKYEIVYSPFEVYRILIPPFQIGHVECREVDGFDKTTGVGPIPLSDEDFKKRKKIEYLTSLPLETQLAAHINPKASNYERENRAFFASISVDNIDYDAVQQKLEESTDVVRKAGIPLNPYKEGFRRISRECEVIERKFEKKLTKEYKEYKDNIENWRKIIKLLNILYEITPVV
ncbi:MAG: hypothetical protein ACO2OO_00555 [Candidatus Aenigmatarchaeota archaeon]